MMSRTDGQWGSASSEGPQKEVMNQTELHVHQMTWLLQILEVFWDLNPFKLSSFTGNHERETCLFHTMRYKGKKTVQSQIHF